MNTEDKQKLFESAWYKWGEESQLKMLAEECAELIQAILKYDRVVNGSRIDDIAEELIDVEICIEQVRLMMFSGQISKGILDNIKDSKLARLKEILNG
jgi:NTP pyrophosphatase (non-canonical NTP hydrolase)